MVHDLTTGDPRTPGEAGAPQPPKYRVAVVTGAGSGIGSATARRLHREGAAVACLDRDVTALNEMRDDNAHDRWRTYPVDVADSAAVFQTIGEVIRDLGRIDILVTAAGVDQCDTVVDTTLEQWRTIISVDLDGVFYACKAVLPAMIEQQVGSIITLSSAIGSVGYRQRSAYCAAKAGVENLTRAIALDYGGQGVRANCVAPGLIDTPLIRGGKVGGDADPTAMQDMVSRHHAIPRIGRADEVAAAICFLAGPDSSFITGAIVPVDAGWTAQ